MLRHVSEDENIIGAEALYLVDVKEHMARHTRPCMISYPALQVRWLGYDPSFDTWEPRSMLCDNAVSLSNAGRAAQEGGG